MEQLLMNSTSSQTFRKKRCVGYARVSTQEQAEEGYSIDAQIQTIQEYCQRENMECVVRGGSWDQGSDYCRSAARHHLSPSESNNSCGFRVIREIALSSVQAENIDALNNGDPNIPNFQAQP